jgi:hypothetical protein
MFSDVTRLLIALFMRFNVSYSLGRMLVVRYGMQYSSMTDANAVATALKQHPEAPGDLDYPIFSLDAGGYLLLPRLSNGQPIKHKVQKRWVYQQLHAQPILGKSKHHADIGTYCHQITTVQSRL